MAKKTRRKTGDEDMEIQHGNPGENPHEAAEPIEDDDPLAQIESICGGSNDYLVRVAQWDQNEGAFIAQGRYPAAGFDPYVVCAQLAEPGAGIAKFRLQILNAKHQIQKTITHRQRRTAQATGTPRVPARPDYYPQQFGDAGSFGRGDPNDRYSGVADAVRAAVAPIMQRLDAVERGRDQLSIRDIMPLMRPADTTSVKDLLPFLLRERQVSPMAEMVQGMRELKNVGDELAGGGSGGGRASDTEILADLLPQIRAIIQDFRGGANSGVSKQLPAAPGANAGEPPADDAADAEEQLRELLVTGSNKSGKPAVYADLVVDVLGVDIVDAMLQSTTDAAIVEHITGKEPAIKIGWIQSVIAALRQLRSGGVSP